MKGCGLKAGVRPEARLAEAAASHLGHTQDHTTSSKMAVREPQLGLPSPGPVLSLYNTTYHSRLFFHGVFHGSGP